MELSSSLLGCSRMLWFHKKLILSKIRRGCMTKQEYDKLKDNGKLYKLFPKATGDFDKDCDYVFLARKETREQDQRFIDVFDVFSAWSNKNEY
jgi:hypothetical protein